MTDLSADELHSKFTAFAEAAGVEELGKSSFISLVQALTSQGQASPLKEADLDMAFTLADEDKSGSVDVFEFIKLFRLIREGKVEGLGKKTFLRRKSNAKLAAQVKSALCDDGKPFEAGALVNWVDADDDIPSGTVGKVLCCHDDGDVEVLFPNPTTGVESTFTFGAARLVKVEPSRKDAEGETGDGSEGDDSSRPRSSTLPISAPATNDRAVKNALDLSADELRGRFAKACTAEGAEDLSKASFKSLVMSLLTNGGQPSTLNALPTERDLDAAFILADEDKSGRVDVYEFIKLFVLVQNGKITGLGRRKSIFGGRGGTNDSSIAKKRAAAVAAIKGEGQPFEPGSAVCWRGEDEDVPKGTIGKVLYCHDDGDVEVLFRSAVSSTEAVYTFGADRLYEATSGVSNEAETTAEVEPATPTAPSDEAASGSAQEVSSPEVEASDASEQVSSNGNNNTMQGGVEDAGGSTNDQPVPSADAAGGFNPLIQDEVNTPELEAENAEKDTESKDEMVADANSASAEVPRDPDGSAAVSSQPPCHQCGEPWAAQSGFLLGDGKHSRCCRLCGIGYCHKCKFIHMTKAFVPTAAQTAGAGSAAEAPSSKSDDHGTSPQAQDDTASAASCPPPLGNHAPSRGADAWTCRPCAAANGVTLDSKACVECKAPWIEKDSFLGSGQHSRACVTCGKAYCYKCKDKHMVKEGAVDGWYKGLCGRGDTDATKNDVLVLSKPVRRRECLDCRSGNLAPPHGT